MKRTFPVLLIVAGRLLAWAPAYPVQLEVLSATVNLDTHRVAIVLLNPSAKVVVGYNLEFRQLDAASKTLSDTRVGWNNQSYNPAGVPAPQQGRDLILPGKTITLEQPTLAGTVSMEVTVLALVYDDRTYEGTEHDVFPLFDVRARNAQMLRQVAALMRAYPVTPEGFRRTIQAARAVDPGRIDSLLYENLKLPLEVATDYEHPLPAAVAVPGKRQWQTMVAALSDEAAFWMEQSQKVAQ